MKMAADVFISQTRAKKQCRRVNSSTSYDHSFASNVDPATIFRASFDARRRPSFDANPQAALFCNQSPPCNLCIGQPGLRASLLRSQGAAVAAVATNFALIAAHHVARH